MTDNKRAALRGILAQTIDGVIDAYFDALPLGVLVDWAEFKYSDDQPRDESGRWTSDGGGDGESSSPMSDIHGATESPEDFSASQLERYKKYDELIVNGGDWGRGLGNADNKEYENIIRNASYYYDATTREWGENLDEDVKISLKDYTTEYYVFTNEYLRTGSIPEKINLPDAESEEGFDIFMSQEEVDTAIRNMDDAIDGYRLPYDTILYRGMEHDPALSPGDRLTDKAFVSTSINPHIAAFHGGDSNHQTIFRIQAPAGTHAAWTASPAIGSNNDYELEFLLGRGTTFEIINTEPFEFRSHGSALTFRGKVYNVRIVSP